MGLPGLGPREVKIGAPGLSWRQKREKVLSRISLKYENIPTPEKYFHVGVLEDDQEP